jgi:hypothetical protein
LYPEDLDTDSPPQALEGETVTCPRCKGEVPSSIYCVACDYPLEIEAADYAEGSEEIHFDLKPLTEMQGESESQNNRESTELHSAEEGDTVKGLKFALEPVEKESLTLSQIFETMKDQTPKDPIEALDTEFLAGPEPPREAPSAEETGDYDHVIFELATELLNSVYLELWSVGLLRKDKTDECLFIKAFEGYRHRLERCISKRDHLLGQIRDLGAHEAKASDARVELDKLDVRKNIGDLHEGEYLSIAPALRWTIDHHEAETERQRGKIALLEDPLSLMPTEKIREAAVMAEEAVELIREAEAIARLSPETAASVRDSIKMIQEILKRTP